jgi:hypothetical protein
MRCKVCDTPNEEGRARCRNCDAPLTAYAGQVTGDHNPETAAKALRLSLRPPVVSVMAILDALAAIFGPFWLVAAKFLARPGAGEEGLNYIGAAIGAVGVTILALLMIPLGLFLLYLAWATWTQRPWAWGVNAVLLLVSALLALLAFASSPIAALIRIGLSAAVAFFWFKPETKDWYAIK